MATFSAHNRIATAPEANSSRLTSSKSTASIALRTTSVHVPPAAMSKFGEIMSMALDGFVAGVNDGVREAFEDDEVRKPSDSSGGNANPLV
jgi:hypothetical protein